MASVWKHPESKYWYARIALPDGRWTSRTTKQTDRNDAMQTAFTMEKAARLARHNELTTAAVVKLSRDLCEAIGAPAIESKTIAQHFVGYLETRKAIGCSAATLSRYRPIIAGFLTHLGTARASASLASLAADEIKGYRNAELASGKGGTTADFAVKVIRAILREALREGVIITNPADAVASTGASAQEREPFSADELTALLKIARGTDWEGMILLGAHCGIRLADAAHLTWRSIDLDRTVTFTPTKTKKAVRLALHPEVMDWIEEQPRGIGKAPLFPTLHENKTGSAGGLSNAFSALMVKAKIAVPEGEKRSGKGRTFKGKGFHGLRHTMISRMANADVTADVRRAIAGHASDSAHRRYVHLNVETQHRAVERMPKLGGAKK